uniref:Claudin n=2 Tax=Scleropages formosus TaxID=113540 RepID=A0A8C9QVJ3_SCLFO
MSNTGTEIFAFLLSISGWIFVAATLPMEYWKVSSNDGSVITTGTYFSNLWKDCVTDTTGTSNCKDFESMLALDGYLHVCRALLVSSVIMSFFGAIFALFGMKCTKIGGSDKTKSKIAFFAGLNFFVSGLCSMAGFSVYAHQIMSEFFDPFFFDIK